MGIFACRLAKSRELERFRFVNVPGLQNQIDKASVLLEALPYLQNFRGKTFLIKVGGSAMEDPALLRRLLRDVVFLEVAGVNPVLVHGGGKAISAAMEAAGLEPTFSGGQRVTTDGAMEIVERTLNERINPELARMIEEFGGRSLGLPGNGVFVGERLTGWSETEERDVSLGRVGQAVEFKLDGIKRAIENEMVPVVSPVASERETGLALNVNADLAASALAKAIKASKLVFLSDVLGVMEDAEDESTLIPSIKAGDVEGMIAEGLLHGGMIPKMRSAVDALEAGVGKVHMIDGRLSHSLLLEIFTESGVGTEIVK